MIVYEDDEDRRREARAAKALGEAWHYDLLRLPRFSLVDYIAVRDEEVRALVEIKTRTTAHDHYPTYMLASKKVDSLIDTANLLKVEALIAILFTDGLWWTDAHEMSRSPVRIGGRHDRPGDVGAIEDTYHMSYELLRRINGF